MNSALLITKFTVILQFSIFLLLLLNLCQVSSAQSSSDVTSYNHRGLDNLFPERFLQPSKPKLSQSQSQNNLLVPKIKKPNKKNKLKSPHQTRIITFASAPGWRTQCNYGCNRKPRINLMKTLNRPCPSPDAKIVSIVNVEWCCVLQKKNFLKANANANAHENEVSSKPRSRAHGFHSQILSALVSPPQCSEPFDGEDNDETVLVGNEGEEREMNAVREGIGGMVKKVTVFSFEDFGVPSATFNISNECTVLPDGWQNRASSLNTHGHCVEACASRDCEDCITLSVGTPSHNRLQDINFDKRIVSFRTCPLSGSGSG